MHPRSRKFDGCWTCRERKIKCDATRPNCLKCAKANLVCKGYNIVLVWADISTIGNDSEIVLVPMSKDSQIQRDRGWSRRNVDLVKFPPAMTYDTYEQLNKVVSQFDTVGVGAGHSSFTLGPFSVYPSYEVPSKLESGVNKVGTSSPMLSKRQSHSSASLKRPRLEDGVKRVQKEEKVKKNHMNQAQNTSQNISLDHHMHPRVRQMKHQSHVSHIGHGDYHGFDMSRQLSNQPHRTNEQSSQMAESHHNKQNHHISLEKTRGNSPFNLNSEGEPQTHPPYILDGRPEESILSKTDNAYVHYELLDFTKLTVLAIKGPRYRFSEQGMFHILYPNFFPNIESDDWKPQSDVLSACVHAGDSGQIILSPILHTAMSHLQSETLAICRVSYKNSSWNSLVIPFLKQILFDVVLEEYSKHQSWQELIIPMGLETVPRDLLLRNIKLAIFCSTIAISLYAKSQSGPRVETRQDSFYINGDLRLSIELRKFAIIIINYHLDEYHDNSKPAPDDGYDCYFLLALILQIHCDNIFEVFENFELIYAIGDFILKKTKNTKHMSPVERHLRNKFNILNEFYESTQAINFFNYSIPEKDKKLKYSDLSENYDLTADASAERDDSSVVSEEESEVNDYESNVKVASNGDSSRPFSLVVNIGPKPRPPKSESFSDIQALHDQMNLPEENLSRRSPITPKEDDTSIYLDFGIPRSLLQLFHETVQLTNHKNVFKSKGVTPRNFPRICADMQDRLFNWSVESHWKLYDNEYNPISNVTTRIFVSDFHEGLYYNVVSIHNAMKVYFKRLIPGSPIESYQNIIEECFASIRNLVTLTQKIKGQKRELQFCPSFWPLLVCGCDIDIDNRPDLQNECQELWKSPCFITRNNWRSKQILYEVWHRRSQDKENNGFMDMIREWAIVLSLG